MMESLGALPVARPDVEGRFCIVGSGEASEGYQHHYMSGEWIGVNDVGLFSLNLSSCFLSLRFKVRFGRDFKKKSPPIAWATMAKKHLVFYGFVRGSPRHKSRSWPI
ncbi:hypothetical protein DPSP01_008248 [Paraphaeosphaeria sporulosa]